MHTGLSLIPELQMKQDSRAFRVATVNLLMALLQALDTTGSGGMHRSTVPTTGGAGLMYYNSSIMDGDEYNKKYGFSVRCLKDN